jgi:hypothetical protein
LITSGKEHFREKVYNSFTGVQFVKHPDGTIETPETFDHLKHRPEVTERA